MSTGTRIRSIPSWLWWMLAILAANALSVYQYFRIDLTADGRYTLSDLSRKELDSLTDGVHITSYLAGDLPLEYSRLARALEDLAREYGARSGRRVQFQTQDPQGEADLRRREYLMAQLQSRGARPIVSQSRDANGTLREQLLFPCLSISSAEGRSMVNLLGDRSLEEVGLPAAIASLEYSLSRTLYRLRNGYKPTIALLEGHGGLRAERTASLEALLAEDFQVARRPYSAEEASLEGVDVAMLLGPTEPIPEEEKLILDQFLMRGGKLLFAVSGVEVAADSLERGSNALARPLQVNLDDMLFRYGVRIAPLLLQDMRCAPVPVNTALAGQPARFSPMPWLYYPLLAPLEASIGLCYSRYASPIELVGKHERKSVTPLLLSSPNTRMVNTPGLISMAEIGIDPNKLGLNAGICAVGVLLEGEFASVFTNRPLGAISKTPPRLFRPVSNQTSVAIIGDGNFARNDLARQKGRVAPTPVGYDRYTQRTFGNGALLQHLALRMTGQNEWLTLRAREISTPGLEPARTTRYGVQVRLLNVIAPLACLLIAGLSVWLFRRRHYGRKPATEKGNRDG